MATTIRGKLGSRWEKTDLDDPTTRLFQQTRFTIQSSQSWKKTKRDNRHEGWKISWNFGEYRNRMITRNDSKIQEKRVCGENWTFEKPYQAQPDRSNDKRNHLPKNSIMILRIFASIYGISTSQKFPEWIRAGGTSGGRFDIIEAPTITDLCSFLQKGFLGILPGKFTLQMIFRR